MDIQPFAREYIERLIAGLGKIPYETYGVIVRILFDAYDRDQQIFICGNGGSASIASHMACDLGKGTVGNVHNTNEKRFRVLALTDNMPLVSALANDVGYEHVFSQQLENLLRPGDVVIGISGSGNSMNVVNALLFARQRKAVTVGFIGFDGGKMKQYCDYALHFEERSWQRAEDAHGIFQHLITAYIKEHKQEHDRLKGVNE